MTNRPDWEIVSRLTRGVPLPPGRTPSYADRVEAVRHFAGNGYSDAQTAALISRVFRMSQRTVQRIRRAYGIPGLAVGTNAATRPRGDLVTTRR